MLPAAGSRYLVPVLRGVQRISPEPRLFFWGAISREKKPFFWSLLGHPEGFSGWVLRAGPDADFAASRDGRRGGPPSRGRIHEPGRSYGQVLLVFLRRFRALIHSLSMVWVSTSVAQRPCVFRGRAHGFCAGLAGVPTRPSVPIVICWCQGLAGVVPDRASRSRSGSRR